VSADGVARHDLRLVPAALVGWVVVLSGLYLGSLVAAALGVGGLLVAGAAALRGRSAVMLAVGGGRSGTRGRHAGLAG
jgi:hypothetical protein